MKIFSGIAASVVALSLAGAANAVTVTTQEPNFSEMLHNNNGADSATMQMFSKPGFFLMDVSSSEVLAQSGGGTGHASLTAADGALTDVTFKPSTTILPGTNLFDAFAPFGVKVDLTKSGEDSETEKKVNFASYTYDVMFTFTNTGPLTITLPGAYLADLPSSGQTNFYADVGEGAFTSIKFFNAVGYSEADQQGTAYSTTFASFKQPSFDLSVVPEPTTWALMILGFGGVGALARRRRTMLA